MTLAFHDTPATQQRAAGKEQGHAHTSSALTPAALSVRQGIQGRPQPLQRASKVLLGPKLHERHKSQGGCDKWTLARTEAADLADTAMGTLALPPPSHRKATETSLN